MCDFRNFTGGHEHLDFGRPGAHSGALRRADELGRLCRAVHGGALRPHPGHAWLAHYVYALYGTGALRLALGYNVRSARLHISESDLQDLCGVQQDGLVSDVFLCARYHQAARQVHVQCGQSNGIGA